MLIEKENIRQEQERIKQEQLDLIQLQKEKRKLIKRKPIREYITYSEFLPEASKFYKKLIVYMPNLWLLHGLK